MAWKKEKGPLHDFRNGLRAPALQRERAGASSRVRLESKRQQRMHGLMTDSLDAVLLRRNKRDCVLDRQLLGVVGRLFWVHRKQVARIIGGIILFVNVLYILYMYIHIGTEAAVTQECVRTTRKQRLVTICVLGIPDIS